MTCWTFGPNSFNRWRGSGARRVVSPLQLKPTGQPVQSPFDLPHKIADNSSMSTDTVNTAELVREIQERLKKAAAGIRDPEEMRRARENMNRMREELRQRIGIVNVAVDLIRDARDQ